jgi:hypothetical protein
MLAIASPSESQGNLRELRWFVQIWAAFKMDENGIKKRFV